MGGNLENEVVFAKLKSFARAQCYDEIKAFADCSNTGLVDIIWKCRPAKENMNVCVSRYTTPEYFEKFAETHIMEMELNRRERMRRKLLKEKQEREAALAGKTADA